MFRSVALFPGVLVVCLFQAIGMAAPPYSGTIFLNPDIITTADPTTYTGITYTGQANRVAFDRRVNAFVTMNAFLFTVTYSDHAPIEVRVNPEFATAAAAQIQADLYARVIGQLPSVLRTNIRTITIQAGVQPFGGGTDDILVHTGQGALYAASGILEETLVHEASHTSLDPTNASSRGWLAAQTADPDFISTYARDNPTREDVAESFLPYLMVRYRRDRIPVSLAATIQATIPNRILYFDAQNFNVSPFTTSTATPGPPRSLTATASGSSVTLSWNAPFSGGAPTSYTIEAGSTSGASNLASFATGSTATSFSTSGVGAGTYFVRVKATNGAGISEPSNEAILTVGSACALPGAPSALTGTGISGTVRLAWTAASGSPTTYLIDAGTATGLADVVAGSDLGGSGTSFTASGVPRGTYYIRIRAKNACGTGSASNEIALVVN